MTETSDTALAEQGKETLWSKEEEAAQVRRRTAMMVSVLLYVGIYLWGLIMAIQSLGERKSSSAAS